MPPTTAPGAKARQDAIVVRRLAPSRESPIVSTIENPQGDQAPVRPIKRAAPARLSSRPLTPAARSAWNVRLVVGDAEDLAASVAVAVKRGVPVDPPVVVRAAIPELADPS